MVESAEDEGALASHRILPRTPLGGAYPSEGPSGRRNTGIVYLGTPAEFCPPCSTQRAWDMTALSMLLMRVE